MSAPAQTTSCPCGHAELPADAKFCPACGTPTGPRACAACGAPLSAQARFCHRCGRPAVGAPGAGAARAPEPAPVRPGDRTPWYIAGTVIVVLLGAIIYNVWKGTPQPVAPVMANAGNADPNAAAQAPFAGPGVPGGRAPDITNMTPQERFARLNDRVMRAAEAGDTATVVNFTPMALGAYSQLPPGQVDVDSRYHAAMLYAGVGQYDAAKALADTVLAQAPGNLFGYIIRGTVAQVTKDAAGVKRNFQLFLEHYDAQVATKRPEYIEHSQLLEGFQQAARQP